MTSIDPNEYYSENSYRISREDLKTMYESNSPTEALMRFMNNLEDFVFGVQVFEGELGTELHLFYAQDTSEFNAIGISIPIEDYKLADNIIIVFTLEILSLNQEKDFFNVHNHLQYHRQNALEVLGYFTFNPNKVPKDGTMLAFQPVIPIKIYERLSFLKSLYEDSVDKPHLDPVNKVYLMLDDTNGLIKIGKSKNPKVRERTLQSEKSQTHLIVQWTAPASVEKELHKIYSAKNVRGEWFRFSLRELDEIKEYMDAL